MSDPTEPTDKNAIVSKVEKKVFKIDDEDCMYTGMLKNDSPHGFGELFCSEERSMKGEWVNGELHGNATLQNDTVYYDGKFSRGFPDKGCLLRFKRPGEFCYYSGAYKEFKMHGHGLMTCIPEG